MGKIGQFHRRTKLERKSEDLPRGSATYICMDSEGGGKSAGEASLKYAVSLRVTTLLDGKGLVGTATFPPGKRAAVAIRDKAKRDGKQKTDASAKAVTTKCPRKFRIMRIAARSANLEILLATLSRNLQV